MDTERNRLTIHFFPIDTLDMDNVFQTVDGGDFAFATFVRTARDEDLVVFADGYCFDLRAKSKCQSTEISMSKARKPVDWSCIRRAFLVAPY